MEEENTNTIDVRAAGMKKLQVAAMNHLAKVETKNTFVAITDEDRTKMLHSLDSVDWVSARKILEKNPQFFDAEKSEDHPIFYAAMNPSVKVLQEVINGMMKSGKTTVPRQKESHPLFLRHDLPMNVAARRGLVDNFCYLMTLSSWESFALEPLVFECIRHNSHEICKMVMDARPDLQNFVFLKLAQDSSLVSEWLNGTPSSLAKFGIDSLYVASTGDDYQGLFSFALLQFQRDKVGNATQFSDSWNKLNYSLHSRGRVIIDHYASKGRRLGDGKFQESSRVWFEKAFVNEKNAFWFDEYEKKSFARQLKKKSTRTARTPKRVKI